MNKKIMFWILKENGHGVCSNCYRQDIIDPLARYCRYCGAEIIDDDMCDRYYKGKCLGTKEMEDCRYFNNIFNCPIHKKIWRKCNDRTAIWKRYYLCISGRT